MRIVLISMFLGVCALTVVSGCIAHAKGRPLLWRRILGSLAAIYATGVVLGCWPADAALAPALPIIDRLLVRR